MAVATQPRHKGWKHIVGHVYASVVVENFVDVAVVDSGLEPGREIRSVEIAEMLADTGASHLFLPLQLIEQLGLGVVRHVEVATAGGPATVRIYSAARVTVTSPEGESRSGTFELIELPGGSEPLLGLTVLEGLGVIPDVVNHRLAFLPERGPNSHITAWRPAERLP
jgi:predicted aspartyl protease